MEQKGTSYFLFGSEAVNIFDSYGVDELIKRYKNYEIHVDIFEFTDGETTPQELLAAYDGYIGWTGITKEEFYLLKMLIQ